MSRRFFLYRLSGALSRFDRLRLALGLWRAPAQLPDEVLAVLVGLAERFLRAGGALSPADWLGLSRDERAAFVAAGDRVQAERAGVTGAAASGLPGLLAVTGALDGGRLRDDAVLESRSRAMSIEREKSKHAVRLSR